MGMTRDDHEAVTGTTGAQTGFDTPDPKDAHQGTYSTTPAENRVGAADHGKYEPVQVPDAREVTGKFDHLATRDVQAMERAPQEPEFVGAETVETLGGVPELLDGVVPTAGLGLGASVATALESRELDVDPNPQYTPPSARGPVRQHEQPGDLPDGETAELKNEVQGTQRH